MGCLAGPASGLNCVYSNRAQRPPAKAASPQQQAAAARKSCQRKQVVAASRNSRQQQQQQPAASTRSNGNSKLLRYCRYYCSEGTLSLSLSLSLVLERTSAVIMHAAAAAAQAAAAAYAMYNQACKMSCKILYTTYKSDDPDARQNMRFNCEHKHNKYRHCAASEPASAI